MVLFTAAAGFASGGVHVSFPFIFRTNPLDCPSHGSPLSLFLFPVSFSVNRLCEFAFFWRPLQWCLTSELCRVNDQWLSDFWCEFWNEFDAIFIWCVLFDVLRVLSVVLCQLLSSVSVVYIFQSFRILSLYYWWPDTTNFCVEISVAVTTSFHMMLASIQCVNSSTPILVVCGGLYRECLSVRIVVCIVTQSIFVVICLVCVFVTMYWC